MSQSSAKTENVVSNLKHDFDIAVNCFIDNGIEPHTPKYQFMVMSNNDIDTHNLKPNDTTKLISQSDVVMLGIKSFIRSLSQNMLVPFAPRHQNN